MFKSLLNCKNAVEKLLLFCIIKPYSGRKANYLVASWPQGHFLELDTIWIRVRIECHCWIWILL
jgi:hypothetical protein